MADNTDLPLPDITPDNFRRECLRFELLAKAKKWSEQEQLGIIPTLLRDKLLDIYDELPDTEKSGLKELKRPLRRQQEQLEIRWQLASNSQNGIREVMRK